MKNQKFLHIGCGNAILPKPFLNIDGRDLEGVDLVCDLKGLPFDDCDFDLIYCSHVLEHFKRNEIETVLSEWFRCLKKGGIFRISVPDFSALTKIYAVDNDLDKIVGPLLGGQDYVTNFHYSAFDYVSLKTLLEKIGLESIHKWNPRRTCHSKFWDFSQAQTNEIPISLNLQGYKPDKMLNFKTHNVMKKIEEKLIHAGDKNEKFLNDVEDFLESILEH